MDTTLLVGSYLIALAITVAVSLILMGALNQPLRRFLLRLSNSQERTDFITRILQMLVLLLPAVAILLSAGFARTLSEPVLFFRVLYHLAWSGVGMISAIVVVAVWATAVEGVGGDVPTLRPGQIDDLQRLVSKVEVMRARDLISRESIKSMETSKSSEVGT